MESETIATEVQPQKKPFDRKKIIIILTVVALLLIILLISPAREVLFGKAVGVPSTVTTRFTSQAEQCGAAIVTRSFVTEPVVSGPHILDIDTRQNRLLLATLSGSGTPFEYLPATAGEVAAYDLAQLTGAMTTANWASSAPNDVLTPVWNIRHTNRLGGLVYDTNRNLMWLAEAAPGAFDDDAAAYDLSTTPPQFMFRTGYFAQYARNQRSIAFTPATNRIWQLGGTLLGNNLRSVDANVGRRECTDVAQCSSDASSTGCQNGFCGCTQSFDGCTCGDGICYANRGGFDVIDPTQYGIAPNTFSGSHRVRIMYNPADSNLYVYGGSTADGGLFIDVINPSTGVLSNLGSVASVPNGADANVRGIATDITFYQNNIYVAYAGLGAFRKIDVLSSTGNLVRMLDTDNDPCYAILADARGYLYAVCTADTQVSGSQPTYLYVYDLQSQASEPMAKVQLSDGAVTSSYLASDEQGNVYAIIPPENRITRISLASTHSDLPSSQNRMTSNEPTVASVDNSPDRVQYFASYGQAASTCTGLCTDGDGDGYGVSGSDLSGCTGSTTIADCDDTSNAVNPGATEICSNAVDNDCDGLLNCADSSCNGQAGSGGVCQSPVELACADGFNNDPSTDVWLFGYTGTNTVAGYHHNGNSDNNGWTDMTSFFDNPAFRSPRSTGIINGVWGSSENDVYASSSDYSMYKISPSPGYQFGQSSGLQDWRGIWGTDDRSYVWVATETISFMGTSSYSGGIFRLTRLGQGGAWGQMYTTSLGANNGLNAIWGSSADDVWAVGESAQVYRSRNARAENPTWTNIRGSISGTLYGVWGPDGSTVYVVGDRVYRTVNGEAANPTWTRLSTGTTQTLRSIWAADADNIWAVGNAGTILNIVNANTFNLQTSGVSSNLNSVWGRSASDIWAAGDNGVLLHYDGSTWQTVTSPNANANFRSIWGFVDDQADCADQDCRAASNCQVSCTAGTRSCVDGDTFQVCNAQGNGYASTDCDTGLICQEGNCVDSCTAGTRSCVDGDTYQVCNAQGTGYDSTDCAARQSCQTGGCVDWVCTPGERSCGTTPRVCNADGLGYSNEAACSQTERCVDGNCQSLNACTEGQEVNNCVCGSPFQELSGYCRCPLADFRGQAIGQDIVEGQCNPILRKIQLSIETQPTILERIAGIVEALRCYFGLGSCD